MQRGRKSKVTPFNLTKSKLLKKFQVWLSKTQEKFLLFFFQLILSLLPALFSPGEKSGCNTIARTRPMIKFCFSKVIPAWLKPGGPHGVQQGSQMCSATGLPFPSPAANIWLSTRSGYYSRDLLSSLPPPSPVYFPQWHLRGEKSL